MTSSNQHAGRRRSSIAVAASVVLALVGAVVLFLGTRTSDGAPQPSTYAGPSPSPAVTAPPAPAGKPTASNPPPAKPLSTMPAKAAKATAARAVKATDLGPILPASPPVAISIPSIGVRTGNFVDLGLTADGSLEVPTDFSAVGWYTGGPTPGELGPSVLTAHVDSRNGPAVFYRLGALRPGAQVSIARKDGSTAKFAVDRIQRFRKDQFPTELVYGSTSRAEIRLITCGGVFDKKSGHYTDNIVAFAHLVQ